MLAADDLTDEQRQFMEQRKQMATKCAAPLRSSPDHGPNHRRHRHPYSSPCLGPEPEPCVPL